MRANHVTSPVVPESLDSLGQFLWGVRTNHVTLPVLFFSTTLFSPPACSLTLLPTPIAPPFPTCIHWWQRLCHREAVNLQVLLNVLAPSSFFRPPHPCFPSATVTQAFHQYVLFLALFLLLVPHTDPHHLLLMQKAACKWASDDDVIFFSDSYSHLYAVPTQLPVLLTPSSPRTPTYTHHKPGKWHIYPFTISLWQTNPFHLGELSLRRPSNAVVPLSWRDWTLAGALVWFLLVSMLTCSLHLPPLYQLKPPQFVHLGSHPCSW